MISRIRHQLDEVLTRTDAAGARSFLEDVLGSTVALTDATGSLYTYEPFGQTTVTGATSSNQHQYTGRENDGTSLYYYRARYYDPSKGRFLSEDPLGFFSGTANFYAYVHNDPINLSDPFGLKACKDATKNCLQRALESLFPGVTANVGDATQEVGGHWNFNVQLQFSSYDAANAFYSAYTTSTNNGFYPPARFGAGPALHLENLSSSWSVNGETRSIAGTAHIDLYNPNDTSQGGGGFGGRAGHVGIDFIVGQLVQAFGGNLDARNCPW